jgi:hypothetical protein
MKSCRREPRPRLQTDRERPGCPTRALPCLRGGSEPSMNNPLGLTPDSLYGNEAVCEKAAVGRGP